MMFEAIFDAIWSDASSDTWAGVELLIILPVLIAILCGQVYGPQRRDEDD